jgi:hypothetical protein
MEHPIFPTAYLPPISWWVLAIRYQTFTIEYFETYPKQTYRNRSHIYSAKGILPLSVPIKKPHGNHTQTKDITIDYSLRWQQIHWRAIAAAYNKTPYFQFYKDYFYPYYQSQTLYLVDLNLKLIELCISLLKLTGLSIQATTRYEHQIRMDDYRTLIHPKKISLLSSGNSSILYQQIFEPIHGFIPDLSIIDLLFNEGPGSKGILQQITVNVDALNDQDIQS